MLLRGGVEEPAALTERARATVARLDGIVFTGGTDISPTAWGEQPLDPAWAGDVLRDTWEIALYHAAIKAHIPVLGICRGCQLINVAEGGSLWQDLVTIKGSEVHRSQELYDGLSHDITLVAGSELEDIFGDAPRHVNSIHHQGAREVGAALSVQGRSPDDVIEGLLRVAPGPWVLGVQFHPEWMTGSALCARIFDRFMEKVMEQASG